MNYETLDADFFGVHTRIHVDTANDAAHLRYYLHDHLRSVGDSSLPRVSIRLEVDGEHPFVATLGKSCTKRIWCRSWHGRWSLYEQFAERASRVSPIPPLSLRPLVDRLSVRHGAAVAAPDANDAALVITGGSGAGKSLVLLHLLRAGWPFVSDDLLVLERRDRWRVHYYGRPIGVRTVSLPLCGWLDQRWLDRAVTVPTMLGTTYMVRPEWVGSKHRSPCTVRWRLDLSRDTTFSYRSSGATTWVRWRPDSHLSHVLDLCARLGSQA